MRRWVFCWVGMVFCGCAVARADGLKSPWDGVPLVKTDVAYECPAPPVFTKTIEIASYYVDSRASVPDPKKLAAFQKASEGSTKLSQEVSLAADAYRAKGSGAAAVCVYSLLGAAAKAGAWAGKMPTFQGVYIQNWLLSAVAISYLKVRQSGVGTPEEEKEIHRWLGTLGGRVREYFDEEIQRVGSDGRTTISIGRDWRRRLKR